MKRRSSNEMVRLAMVRETFGHGLRQLTPGRPQAVVGVEALDDAALVQISELDDECLVVATDFVRGSGFYLFEDGLLDYYDLGYYLIIANMSDIAAMGGNPFAVLTVLRYSDRMTDDRFTAALKGMKAAADTIGVEVIGGDIGGYQADVFAATALGTVNKDRALLRRNAAIGELVCLSGSIGLPITALTYFKEAKPKGFTLASSEEERLLASWKRPIARIREGLILTEHGLSHAAQDISDGLKATIDQMSSAAGHGFTIYADRLPIDETTIQLADFLGVDPIQVAASASVDFQLMFTVSSEKATACFDLFRQHELDCVVIGEVNREGQNILVHRDGARSEIPGVAWKQQRDGYLKDIVQPR